MYGGAAGGGKTDAIIACAARWIDHPKHRALILRRTRPQLQEVIDRTRQIYPEISPGARWKEDESRWIFPSGAIIQMGYAEHEQDIMNFKSFEYNLICFDELTTFTEKQYLFLFTRNRTKSADLPPMIRTATNPGDVGHEWVYRRFISDRKPYKIYDEPVDILGKQHFVTRQFIPSRVWDNPAMPNRDEYIAGIMQMSPEDVAAYLHGEWDRLAGAMFQPLTIAPMNDLAKKEYYTVRSIDFGIYDPTCVLWLAYYPEPDLIDVVSEVYLRDTDLDSVVDAIKARETAMAIRPPVYSVGSPEMFNKQATSNQSIATMLATMGVPIERGNTDLKAGWARLRLLQQRQAIRVWPGNDPKRGYGAPNLIRTLPHLQRDTGINKDPDKLRARQEDHAADALRYGVMVIFERPDTYVAKAKEPEDPNRDYVYDKMVKDLQMSHKKNFIPDLGNW